MTHLYLRTADPEHLPKLTNQSVLCSLRLHKASNNPLQFLMLLCEKREIFSNISYKMIACNGLSLS